jgi:hypothetical protein
MLAIGGGGSLTQPSLQPALHWGTWLPGPPSDGNAWSHPATTCGPAGPSLLPPCRLGFRATPAREHQTHPGRAAPGCPITYKVLRLLVGAGADARRGKELQQHGASTWTGGVANAGELRLQRGPQAILRDAHLGLLR